MEEGKERQEESFGFDVTEAQEHEIRIGGKLNGKRYTVLHVLRDPTPKQWKNYEAETSCLKPKRGQPEFRDRSLAAREKLWNEIVVRVEGYRKAGEPLECQGEQWKQLIPILHKSAAIRDLGEIWNEGEDDDDEKNSETASDD